jgi:putative addiction module component (TIGR02574 family)
MKAKLLADILSLTPAERIHLAQDIWESVSEIPDASILTDLQKEELDRRLAALERRSNSGIPWRDALAEIRQAK